MPELLSLSYVLPMKAAERCDDPELTGYLRDLARHAEVLVVDGSAPAVFDLHHRSWDFVRHLPVDPAIACRSGKVAGVLTGLREARGEVVVLADDDVRWDPEGLERAVALTRDAHLVVPQNHFAPLPWHARWDTARTLLARLTGGDFPGTLVVRRNVLLATGGYDGDCLFENLELIRTVEAAGGTARWCPDLYVRRLPPTARHFWSQRVRQAYDEFARPVRLIAALAVLPAAGAAVHRRALRSLALATATSVALAEAGRRRAGGRRYFPASAALLAPVWLLERAVCSWVALYQRLVLGGTPYAGSRLAKAANSRRALRAQAVDRYMGRAARGEGRPSPVRPALLQPQAGQAGHQVQLAGPGVAVVGR